MDSVTIITPVRNGAATIEATLASVASQDHPSVEHIVVDGGSTDATLDVARRYDVVLICGPDEGIYDAMNKGIAAARGEWLLFLGADDRLAGPDVLRRMTEAANAETLLVYGDVVYDDGLRFGSRMSRTLLFHNTIHHQGALYRRSLFRDFRYRTDVRAMGDYELNLRLYRSRAAAVRVPLVVSRCGVDGESSSPRNRWRNSLELHRLRAPHVSAAWNVFATAVMLARAAARMALTARSAPDPSHRR